MALHDANSSGATKQAYCSDCKHYVVLQHPDIPMYHYEQKGQYTGLSVHCFQVNCVG